MAAGTAAVPTPQPTVVPVWKLGEVVSRGTPAPFDGYLIPSAVALGKIAVPTDRYAAELGLAEDGRRARAGAYAAPSWYKWTVLAVTAAGLSLQTYREVHPRR